MYLTIIWYFSKNPQIFHHQKNKRIQQNILAYIHYQSQVGPKCDFISTSNTGTNTTINTSTFNVANPHTDSSSNTFDSFIDAVGHTRTNVI